MTLLVRHPDTPPGAIHTVDAEAQRTSDGLVVTFHAIGTIADLVLPQPAFPERADDLWKTTCFEMFVTGEGERYREFNLSPSGAWAAYDFDGARAGMRPAIAEVEIETSGDPKRFTLVAKIRSEFANPARIGLTAVIEERDRALRYWSVAFAPGRPDFHAAATRALLLDGVDAQ